MSNGNHVIRFRGAMKPPAPTETQAFDCTTACFPRAMRDDCTRHGDPISGPHRRENFNGVLWWLIGVAVACTALALAVKACVPTP